jgi:FkbM family methyltransferase
MTEVLDQILLSNEDLRQKLDNLITGYPSILGQVSTKFDVIITPCEVNYKHGTGVLVHRIFGDRANIFSIRSYDHYHGEHLLGEVSTLLPKTGCSRLEIFQNVARLFAEHQAKRVLCIPYYADDILTAIAVKELFGIPLCAYLMDDQNICVDKIPDALMEEFLSKASLRLAISPEMRTAYEKKYGYKFHWLPPVVPNALLQTTARLPASSQSQTNTGILVGNLWGQTWLSALQKTIRGSGLHIDWYGNTQVTWMTFSLDELSTCGIRSCGFLPEAELAPLLRDYPYAVVPSSTLDKDDENLPIAKLSLPSRIVYLLAASGTPIIVLGSKDTAAARFVQQFQIGTVCDYTATSFLDAVQYVTDPDRQSTMRQNAAKLAELFAVDGIENWIWQSLDLGHPADQRFDDLVPRSELDLVPYLESPAPKTIWRDYKIVYQTLQRLQRVGFNPEFVIDVGASTGVWSDAVNHLFPQARFVLVEPLISRHDPLAKRYYIDPHPNFEVAEVALSNYSGRTRFQVSADLYGSSLLDLDDFRTYNSIEVNVITLDNLAVERQITGRGLLKIDVQCAEHLVLEGAKEFLSQIDAIILELSLVRFDHNAKIFAEMLVWLDELGFRYYDDIGEWRLPEYGTLMQKDGLFVRRDRFLPNSI